MVTQMNKKQIEDFKKRTVRKPKLVWDILSDKENKIVDQLADDYKFFFRSSKNRKRGC